MKALMLKTVAADMTAHGGFVWPAEGEVVAPDWRATEECGHGLHGLLWGEGDGSLLDWSAGARWLVCEIDEDAVISLGGKVKVERATVVHCGDRLSATAFLSADPRCAGRVIVGGTATAGDCGTATAGDYGTATAGDYGTIAVRWWDGKRYRLAVGYVGEDGIEPNAAYRVDAGKFVAVTQ